MSDRKIKDYAFISLKGMAMGAADVVPGVSGGTIAFITGIYEELVNTISNVDFSLIKTWKAEGFKAMWNQLNASFLLALILGIGVSVLSLMKLMTYLLDTFPIQVWSFFFGLVLASVWYIAKQIPNWRLVYIVALIISALGAYALTTLTPVGEITSLPYLFLCGALAICAMILPGISGAFILVLLGAYKQIIDAVSDLNFKVISVVGLGAIFGLLSFSRLLKWLFNKFEYLTLSILTGFVFGSLNKIWPWKNTLQTEIIHYKEIIIKQESVLPASFDGDPQFMYAVGLAFLGFILILLLEKWSSKTT